ncbi:2-hydroxy-3-oxopropionate reductase [Burkholderia ubonensis]|uniref:2-hydroxy-3-oxopropionate reductase n=1 Tax=Burkholderia ubonensis TaxID=101571 RepID=A0A102LN37_9BURK|nr:NAD(P)-dependent oxidoreductase [Burkholderia ubonensis]AOI72119.1 2-hydroxy-3-oxopropionate reductase [Burkholderia ubonensis]KUZ19059.1 2-hydroxy-3-oxopropionate reductase [Burkholderia ubonensis]KUZ24423.1 2-hydroxy-3-oxopropionate reductase [Burkholderia ubonensis]KUZ29460.1 2-hydroxy-3-oxopropionate reductase [Burkholderia ubonensis]KUZ50886.1 2-hydroxy-3-oxopropionate reductase [Burkholderia ubonensis]
MEVGFCGPGLMGAPMIRHLLAAGHRVGVWNRTRAKSEALAADGAQVVDTPRALAEQVETVLLCVLDARAVGDVVFGPDGLLSGDAAARRVRRIVDHSSIPPGVTRDYAKRAAELGVGWVDAPVSGGVPGAQAGTLAVMAGGRAEDLDAVRPLIDAYAARITHMGDAGAGQTAKLCNQAIVTATVTAIAEAVGLAQASGIDAARLAQALAGGWADSVLLQTFVPRMTSGGHTPIGALSTFQKDVDTIADAARDTGAVMPVSATVQQVLRLGAAMGLADADFAAFIDIVRPGNGRREA